MAESPQIPYRTPFTGRETERDLLITLLHRANSGSGSLVLLSGHAGVGKSRLVREIATAVRDNGGRAAFTAAHEREEGRPFELVLGLLRSLGTAADAREPVAEAVRTLVAPAAATPETATRWAQIDAVLAAVEAAAVGDPSTRLLVLEDLHWADASTLELLTQILRRIESIGLLVVATFRPPAPHDQPLVAFVDAGRQLHYGTRLHLAPLTSEESLALVRAAAGEEVEASALDGIVTRCGGNPLFIEEATRDAVRAMRSGAPPPRVPDAVRDLVQHRLSMLPETVREVASTLAVLGDAADPARIASLLGVADDAVAAAFEMLDGAGLVTAWDDGRIDFRHALTRDAAYEATALTRRRALHLLCAQRLEAEDGEIAAAAVARHLQRVGGAEHERRAGSLLGAAGEQSLQHLAYEQAAEQFETAAALMARSGAPDSQRLHVRLRYAEARRLTRPDDVALEAFGRLADDAAAAGEVRIAAAAAIGYERTFVATGRPRDGANVLSEVLLDRALGHLEAAGERGPLYALALSATAQARFFAGQREAALALASRAVEIASAGDDPGVEATALDTQRLCTWGPDGLDERLALTRKVIDRAAAAGDQELLLEGMYWQITALLEAGRRSQAEGVTAQFASIAERLHQPRRLSEASRMKAMLAHLRGDRAVAREQAEAAVALAERAGNAEARLYFVAQMNFSADEHQRGAILREMTADPAPWLTTTARRVMLAHLYTQQGDRERAARALATLMAEGIAQLPRDAMWLPLVALLGRAVIAVAEASWAQQVYEALLPYADRFVVNSNAVCYGSAEQLLGDLAAMFGGAEADAHFHRAVERNEAFGATAWLPANNQDAAFARRVVKTFMFTDIVKSTNLVEALGDDAWGVLLQWHNQMLRSLFVEHEGDEVVSTGDGFFVAFDTPDIAIACAIAIQRRLTEHRTQSGFAPQVRIGLHASEAMTVEHDFRGKGVHEAARISALADGGEIVASRETAGSHPTVSAPRLVTLKGIAAPLEVVTLAWR